jgi:endo-1,3-1,4-beta-glycanase ExoK
MIRLGIAAGCFLAVALAPGVARAVGSAEFYTSRSYGYGRFEARIRFAAGDGVISSFFMWKTGSEVSGTFWNELDFEKLGANCHVETNAIYGNPSSNHNRTEQIADPCGGYHTYTYEWTPEAIVWLVDGMEIRRETGAVAMAYAQNAATAGMQLRFNVWPGDASFGGNFSPSILPVHQYVDWVAFASYANGQFTMQWREDFNGALPTGWASATWGSPKNLSTHKTQNVNIVDGHLVLSLTADNALGPAGAMPGNSGGSGGSAGSGSGSGGGGAGASSGGSSAGGSPTGGASGSATGGESGSATGGASGSTMTGGATATGGTATGGASVTGGSPSTGGSAGTAGNAGGADAGSGGSSAPPSDGSADDGGGCAVGPSPGGARTWGWLGLGLAAIALRRFRRRPRAA